MKIYTMLMILLMIQVSVMICDQSVNPEDTTAIPNMYNSTETSLNETTNYFWNFASNPTRWTDSDLFRWATITFVATLIATGVTILGSTLVSSDVVRFSPVFVLLLGVGSIPITSLWGVIMREVGAKACTAGTLSCFPAWLAAFLICGPLAVTWFSVCLHNWRTGSMTS